MPGTMETFVLRVWRPPDDELPKPGPNALRGVVEKPGTGERQPFRNGSELVVFLRGELGADAAVRCPPDRGGTS